jgi:hypothetical protein
MDVSLESQVQAHQYRSNQWLNRVLFMTAASLLLAVSLLGFRETPIPLGGQVLAWSDMAQPALAAACAVCILLFWIYAGHNRTFTEYQHASATLRVALQAKSRAAMQKIIEGVQAQAAGNPLVRAVMADHRSALDKHMTVVAKADLLKQLDADFNASRRDCHEQLAQLKSQVPLIRAQNHIRASLAVLVKRREEVSRQWDEAYEKFSWWNKFKYAGDTSHLTEMDKIIKELIAMEAALEYQHSADFQHLERHFDELKNRALARIVAAKGKAEQFIAECASQKEANEGLLKKALWFSALSLPISAWSDVSRAGDVYDALRDVNGNFAGMSDGEIWWETLFMAPESVAGLASLTKGAYFEQLVAADTGGALHEYFNYPDTDIVIDGVAFQLKATDSAGYVNSVSDEIPVIATSEVALRTDAISSDYSNEELTNAVDLALGGTVVDMGDSAVDSIMSGLGGLGFLATLKGINHAVTKHENGGDAAEAMFEGVGVAIEGTASAFVGAAEIGYKVLASRPSRFVGRMIVKGFVKMDEKLMSSRDKNNQKT